MLHPLLYLFPIKKHLLRPKPPKPAIVVQKQTYGDFWPNDLPEIYQTSTIPTPISLPVYTPPPVVYTYPQPIIYNNPMPEQSVGVTQPTGNPFNFGGDQFSVTPNTTVVYFAFYQLDQSTDISITVAGQTYTGKGASYKTGKGTMQEVAINGLIPDTDYDYTVSLTGYDTGSTNGKLHTKP